MTFPLVLGTQRFDNRGADGAGAATAVIAHACAVIAGIASGAGAKQAVVVNITQEKLDKKLTAAVLSFSY